MTEVVKDKSFSNLIVSNFALFNTLVVQDPSDTIPDSSRLIEDILGGLDTSLEYVTFELMEIQTQNETNEQSNTVNANDIAANAAQIAINTAQVAINTAQIATNTGNIATNTAGISTLLTPFQTFVSGTGSPNGATVNTTRWYQMTGSIFQLTAGTWMMYCNMTVYAVGYPPIFQWGVGFFSANGANNSLVPASINSVSNLTVQAIMNANNNNTSPNTTDAYTRFRVFNGSVAPVSILGPVLRVVVTGTSGNIFVVPLLDAQNNGAQGIRVNYYCQRIL
jgi:hypothetical protein